MGDVWDAAPWHFDLDQPKCGTRALAGESRRFFQPGGRRKEAGGAARAGTWEPSWEGSCRVTQSCLLARAELDREGAGKSRGVYNAPCIFPAQKYGVIWRERETQTCVDQPSAPATGIKRDEYLYRARS